MYRVFLQRANQTVSLQLVMNVLQWIVLSHCIYRVLFVYLNIAGYDIVLKKKRFGVPGIFL